MYRVWHVSIMEFRRWMRSSRMIILAVMLVFVHVQVIMTLQDCSARTGLPVGILEGFIALGNSGVIVLIVPILFLVLMADFPQRDGIDLFYQVRMSKRTWVLGEMLFALEASFFLVLFLLGASIVMLAGCGQWMTEFSDAVTHYSTIFPERTGDYILKLLPENLYQQMTLGAAVRDTFLLIFLYLFFLALVLLASTLFNRKSVGVLIDASLVIFGAVFTSAQTAWMWVFPMAHSITWVHYEKYLRAQVFPMAGSYCYFIVAEMFVIVLCMRAASRYELR